MSARTKFEKLVKKHKALLDRREHLKADAIRVDQKLLDVAKREAQLKADVIRIAADQQHTEEELARVGGILKEFEALTKKEDADLLVAIKDHAQGE
jgi:hypothetical protein